MVSQQEEVPETHPYADLMFLKMYFTLGDYNVRADIVVLLFYPHRTMKVWESLGFYFFLFFFVF